MVNVSAGEVVHSTPLFVNIGVTDTITTRGSGSGLDAVNVMSESESVISVVLSGNPISGPFIIDHSYVVTPPVFSVVKSITTSSPLQTSMFGGASIVGVGLTVIEKVKDGPSHSSPLLVYVGVTVIVETSGEVPAVPTKLGIFQSPVVKENKPSQSSAFPFWLYGIKPMKYCVLGSKFETVNDLTSPMFKLFSITPSLFFIYKILTPEIFANEK